MKHRCSKLPRNVNVEHDASWGWLWTTKDTMAAVNYCPICGVELRKIKEVNQ